MGGVLQSLLASVAQDAWGMLMDTVNESRSAKRGKPADERQGPGNFSGPPPIPDLPAIPALDLPHLPALAQEGAAPVLPPRQSDIMPAPTAASSIADSYAAEMDKPGVACKPCTMRHLTTITEAARTATASDDPEVWRQQVALIAAEALVWEQYDLTPGKLARADEGTRHAVLSARPAVRAMLQGVQAAPERLSLAWGALLESRRFAEGKAPTDEDWRQVQERVADVLGWIGYLESTARDQLGAHLNALRPARQRLTSEGPTHEALAGAEAAAGAAAVALTPAPTRAQVDALHQRSKAARDAFFHAAMGRGNQAAPRAEEEVSRFDPRGWILDRDTLVPARYRQMVPASAYSVTVPQDGLLGATPATAAAWTNLLQFARATGVTVRDRQLPAGFDGIVKGAFNPSDNVLLVSPAATAEDSDGDQTLIHELAHSLLHNRRCLPNPTPLEVYEETYGETVEEEEADASTYLTMAQLGLRIEHDDGTGSPAPDPRIVEASLRESLDPETMRRAVWAAGVLAAAAKQGAGAAAMAAACPVRA